ncbi:MAG: hypothetical protein ABIH87_02405 [bacterium]
MEKNQVVLLKDVPKGHICRPENTISPPRWSNGFDDQLHPVDENNVPLEGPFVYAIQATDSLRVVLME